MQVPKSFVIITLAAILISCRQEVNGRRTKRMYAMCPPKFVRLGNECYYIASEKASWLDAHFECKDRNSKLAEPFKFEDIRLRKYLLRTETEKTSKWIGGIYNWERKTWQWGYNGRAMKYQAFSQMKPGGTEDMKFHCSMMNPTLKFRWSAKPCVEQHNFICQHRMPFVSERNRQRVYAKWNETFPNELANEIEVLVTTNPQNQTTSDGRRRSISRRQYHVNSVPMDNLNPESVSGSRHVQRPNRQGRTDHARNTHRKRPQIVDIGRPIVSYAPDPIVEIRLDSRRQQHHWRHRQRLERPHPQRHHQKHTTTTTSTTTSTTPSMLDYRIVTLPEALNPYENPPQQPQQHRTEPPTTTTDRSNDIEEKPHHHREHHSQHRVREKEYEAYDVTTTTTTETTTTESDRSRKLSEAEKKHRREELRQRLSRLSPEQQHQYILMRKKKLEREKLRNETA